MDSLHIKPTATSLEVILDAQTGKFSFSGRSVSEHSVEFFKPIIDWLNKYSETPLSNTEVVFQFEYFNSAARKSLVEIFNVLNTIHKKGNPVFVTWNYDEGDENMKELGEDYYNMFSLKFKFVEGP